MKTLIFLRHAKSSWKDSSLPDSERPLSGRGKKDAPMMGRRLAALGEMPDIILSSPARRARSTARRVAAELGFPKERISIAEELYEAGEAKIREVARSLDDQASGALMVGHNPGLCELLAELFPNQINRFPTCAFAIVRFEADRWRQLWEAGRELAAFDIPKSGKEKSVRG